LVRKCIDHVVIEIAPVGSELDREEIARAVGTRASWGYRAFASDDDGTMRACTDGAAMLRTDARTLLLLSAD
jgi:hypothetical protein